MLDSLGAAAAIDRDAALVPPHGVEQDVVVLDALQCVAVSHHAVQENDTLGVTVRSRASMQGSSENITITITIHDRV